MPVTDVVCDASVVLKWFHHEGEQEVEEARTLLAAHQAGLLTAWILDLDAAYAAAARSRGAALATADRTVLDAGVGASPGAIAASLGL